MSTAAATPAAEEQAALPRSEALYRDDGPLAKAIGRALPLPLPAMALLLAACAAVLASAAFAGRDASLGLAAGVVAFVVLAVGATSRRWPKESFWWAVPPLVRLSEYAGLVWLATIDDAEPAAFALLAALAFRHYDLVYRFRHRAEVPPDWLNLLAAGWDGRLIIAWILLAVGALPAGMFIWAGLLGVVSVAETVAAWRRFGRVARPAEYDDVEDADE